MLRGSQADGLLAPSLVGGSFLEFTITSQCQVNYFLEHLHHSPTFFIRPRHYATSHITTFVNHAGIRLPWQNDYPPPSFLQPNHLIGPSTKTSLSSLLIANSQLHGPPSMLHLALCLPFCKLPPSSRPLHRRTMLNLSLALSNSQSLSVADP